MVLHLCLSKQPSNSRLQVAHIPAALGSNSITLIEIGDRSNEKIVRKVKIASCMIMFSTSSYNHQTITMCTAQVVLNASVTHLAATQHVPCFAFIQGSKYTVLLSAHTCTAGLQMATFFARDHVIRYTKHFCTKKSARVAGENFYLVQKSSQKLEWVLFRKTVFPNEEVLPFHHRSIPSLPHLRQHLDFFDDGPKCPDFPDSLTQIAPVVTTLTPEAHLLCNTTLHHSMKSLCTCKV